MYVENEYFSTSQLKLLILKFLLYFFSFTLSLFVYFEIMYCYILLFSILYYTCPFYKIFIPWKYTISNGLIVISSQLNLYELSKIELSFCYSSWFSTKCEWPSRIIVYLCCILFFPFFSILILCHNNITTIEFIPLESVSNLTLVSWLNHQDGSISL